jgi:hypothetical protein
MRTSVKLILAAIGAAVMVYPVMAATMRNGVVQPDLSTNNVFWGMPYAAYGSQDVTAFERAHGHAYGYESIGRPSEGHAHGLHPSTVRPAPEGIFEGVRVPLIDCVHVPFPQCSGGN